MLTQAEAEERKRQDTLHVGGTRPAMLLGLPLKLALALLGGWYLILVNVSFAWSFAYLIPGWTAARLAVRKSLYGVNVAALFVQTQLASLLSPFTDRWTWGGASRSPLPSRFQTGPKGIKRVR